MIILLRTVDQNIQPPYSLHDHNIIELRAEGDLLTLITETGMTKTAAPYSRVKGSIEFHKVDWDFCSVYLLEHTGNFGTFPGEKMSLRDFIDRFPVFGLSVMDETFGYNKTVLDGYLSSQQQFYECFLQIYHEGERIYLTEE